MKMSLKNQPVNVTSALVQFSWWHWALTVEKVISHASLIWICFREWSLLVVQRTTIGLSYRPELWETLYACPTTHLHHCPRLIIGWNSSCESCTRYAHKWLNLKVSLCAPYIPFMSACRHARMLACRMQNGHKASRGTRKRGWTSVQSSAQFAVW